MPLIFRSPTPIQTVNTRWPYIIVWLVLSLVVWWIISGFGPHFKLSVDLKSSQDGMAQLFYDRGSSYSERESITRPIKVGLNHIQFTLPSGPIFHLRFDPVNSAGEVSITSIQLRRSVNMPWQVVPLSAWQPIGATKVARDDGMVSLIPNVTADPQLQFVPAHALVEVSGLWENVERCILATLLALAATVMLYKWRAAPERITDAIVPMAMTAAAGLILAMAITSTTNRQVHPDEYSHLFAYQYYVNHWLPPAVDDPATIPSTSVWGFSYLFELDVVYDIAARVIAPFTTWTQDALRSVRMVQVGLWSILCILALCNRRWLWVLSVTLLSPQIWYVFSYFNADAFPLFLAIIAAGLIADDGNGVHQYLRTGEKRSVALWVAIACIGLLLVSKRNFLPVVPVFLLWLAVVHLGLRATAVVAILGGLLLVGTSAFVGAVPIMAQWKAPLATAGLLLAVGSAAWTCWTCWKDTQTRTVLMRLVAFTFLCVAVALPRLAWDVHVNGWPAQKAARIHAVAEARAGHDFKPSVVERGKGNPTVALAARGTSLREVVFAPYNWGYVSFMSAFGVYGYLNIFAPTWTYVCLSGLTLLLALVALHSVRRKYPERWKALIAIVLGGSLLVLASSLLLSWFSALQPQGRYLLPCFALLGLLLGAAAERSSSRVLGAVILTAALISLGSFAFVGLANLVQQ